MGVIALSSYSFKVYVKEKLISEVFVEDMKVNFKNYSDFYLFLPFGKNINATYEDLMEFYEERCFPRERANCKEIIHNLGLDYYDPELICRKTHGLQFDDFIWLQFSDEPQVCWNDIKLRD